MSEVGWARRLFIASPAIGRNVSDFELFDEDRLRREADRSRMVGHVQTGNSFETQFGLPEYAETPRVRVALSNKPLDFYGFDRWILSDRARQLLLEMDPLAFDFVECDTSGPARYEVGTYWLGNVKRVVTDFDHDASDFERRGWMYDLRQAPPQPLSVLDRPCTVLQTAYGPLARKEVYGQVLIVPAAVALFGIGISVISAIIM